MDGAVQLRGRGAHLGDRARAGFAGGVMILHFVLLAALKVEYGLEGEMLWISHASLLLGGIGLVIASRTLVASAFSCVAVLHMVWLVDAAGGLLFGAFPLGLTRYLLDCDLLTLCGTSHHVYLAPVLGWWLVRRGGSRYGLNIVAASLALLAFVTVLSRVAIAPGLNVNLAHAVLPASSSPALLWFNRQPGWVFVPIHLTACLVGAIVPAWVLLRAIVAACRPIKTASGEFSPCLSVCHAASR